MKLKFRKKDKRCNDVAFLIVEILLVVVSFFLIFLGVFKETAIVIAIMEYLLRR